MVVLHGGPGADYQSLLAVQSISSSVKWLFYDQRGAGFSPREPRKKLTLADYLLDLNELIDRFGQGRAILLGHSFGGQLAVAYANQYPEKVDALILLEPGPLNADMVTQGPVTGLTWGTFMLGAQANRAASQQSFVDDDAKEDWVYQQIVYQANPGYWCDKKLAQLPKGRFGARAFAQISESMQTKAADFNLLPNLSNWQEPVLLVASSCNSVIGEAFQREQQRLFAKAEFALIANSGHELLVDQPQQTLEVIEAFLSRSLGL